MKKLLTCVVLFSSFAVQAQVPQLINYQGRLVQGTNLVNGNMGLSLRLFNLPSGGASIYEDSNSVPVADGLYSTFIGDQTTSGNLAVALTNAALWVEIAVNGSTLAPREQIASVAYALTAWNLRGNGGTITGAQFLGTTDNQPFEIRTLNQRVARFDTATNAAGALIPNVILGHSANVASNVSAFGSVIGGGGNQANPQIVGAAYDTVAGGVGNRANGGDSSVVGGRRNVARGLQSLVGGGFGNVAGGFSSTIGGGSNNTIAAGATAGTISGGRLNDIGTNSTDAVISGFDNNVGNSSFATAIGGGAFHDIGTNSSYSTVGGGQDNNVADNVWNATIAGGGENSIEMFADYAAIGGGFKNEAGGINSTVPGGKNNVAANTLTFAAGNRAKAAHVGSFVWADSQDADFATSADNQFLIRADGGIHQGNLDSDLWRVTGTKVVTNADVTLYTPLHVGAQLLDVGSNRVYFAVGLTQGDWRGANLD